MTQRISRREFMRMAGLLGISAWAGVGITSCGRTEGAAPDSDTKEQAQGKSALEDKVAVVRGDDIGRMVEKAVAALGGMGAIVKKGDVVVVKPNIAWITRPELGGCTHPDVVATLVGLCLDAGAKQVKVFDRPCRDPRFTYKVSGIQKAAEAAGARVSFMPDNRYMNLEIPRGRSLRNWPVYRDFVEADVAINAPVAKVHGTTGVTLGMKNLMGVAGGNRGTWHRGIHQKLADWLSALPCALTVIDATRPMMRNGPDGGSPDDLERADTIVAAPDMVAADAWVTKEIFSQSFDRVRVIKLADEMGLGRLDTTGRVIQIAA